MLVCVYIPLPFQTPSGKIWQRKEKIKKLKLPNTSGKKNNYAVCLSCLFLFFFFKLVRLRLGVDLFHLVKGLQAFSFKRLTNCSEYMIRTEHSCLFIYFLEIALVIVFFVALGEETETQRLNNLDK